MKNICKALLAKIGQAPVHVALPPIMIAFVVCAGLVGVALGASFFWSAYAGLIMFASAGWFFARRARINQGRMTSGSAQ